MRGEYHEGPKQLREFYLLGWEWPSPEGCVQKLRLLCGGKNL